MDGVLFDTVGAYVAYTVSMYDGMTVDDMVRMSKGNIYEEFKKANLALRDPDPQVRAALREEYLRYKSTRPLFPGIRELLSELAPRAILAINTAAAVDTCEPLLAAQGIRSFFSLVATKDTSPSKVEKFRIIATECGVHPEDCIFITDSLGDVRESHEANVPTVAVTWGIHDRTTFESEQLPNLVAIVDTAQELGVELENRIQDRKPGVGSGYAEIPSNPSK